jgi:energy-coupling factor transporter ATP-binding protein EcfA2
MAEVLGITGAIGSGKTTFATALASVEPRSSVYESGQIVIELANQFNQALASEMSFELAANDTELVNQALIWFCESIAEQLHQDVTWSQLALTAHRLAMHPQYYEKLFVYLKHAKADSTLVKQSINSSNKQQYRPLLQWLGGYLVATVGKTIWFDEIFRRIDRYDADKRLVIITGLRYPSDAHIVRQHNGRIIEVSRPGSKVRNGDITEANRADIVVDTTVINNGTLEQFTNLAERLYSDIVSNTLAKTYKAA